MSASPMSLTDPRPPIPYQRLRDIEREMQRPMDYADRVRLRREYLDLTDPKFIPERNAA